MSKKRFVQNVIARSLPRPEKRQAALAYALELWEWLCKEGYGADQPSQPRESKNWIELLSQHQRKAFDAFWAAFDLKRDRNNAAMRWYQLGELSRDEYQEIITAARQEAGKPIPPGQSRKMAQGWLFEMRWLDYSKAPIDDSKRLVMELNRLRNELIGLESLYKASKTPELLTQITKLKAQIKEKQSCKNS
ncbi:hypothetical protein [Methylobacter sp.]|uniref:hypothetical protein n=1 Tax=Methylobacter sp. TaxID=2051955 RepID=UPI0024874A6E|nr:hypothetical protein [Methylobacter sp.]MDI1278058.1 hypothetical protein [Methylobacter sp.]